MIFLFPGMVLTTNMTAVIVNHFCGRIWPMMSSGALVDVLLAVGEPIIVGLAVT